MKEMALSACPAFRIGQAQDEEARTGCTVILCEGGAVCGVDVRGGSPATRDTDALHPAANRRHVHAVLLTGGSSFGLNAAGGVMRFLEEKGVGRDVAVTHVPNVAAAALFDLKCGRADVRPDEAMGYEACENAWNRAAFRSGRFGAGCGATVGKAFGREYAMDGGAGAVLLREGELLVGAVAAVNCVGDVVQGGEIIAGAKDAAGRFLDSEAGILQNYASNRDFFSEKEGENTVLACVFTNARLDKAAMTRVAAHGQNGIAGTIRPAHSVFDGDVVFAVCSGEVAAHQDAVGILAAAAVARAIARAVAAV